MNFGLTNGTSGLSLMRILGSLSKTMGIVKQFAPLYKEVKPLLSKAPAFFQRLNSIRNSAYNMRELGTAMSKNFDDSSNQKPEVSSNSPIFFQ